MTYFLLYNCILPCVSAQYPRNRTIFLCLTLIRHSTSRWNSFSCIYALDSFFTATVPVSRIPCGQYIYCFYLTSCMSTWICFELRLLAGSKKKNIRQLLRRSVVGGGEDDVPCRLLQIHLCRFQDIARNCPWFLPTVIMAVPWVPFSHQPAGPPNQSV